MDKQSNPNQNKLSSSKEDALAQADAILAQHASQSKHTQKVNFSHGKALTLAVVIIIILVFGGYALVISAG